MKTYENYLSLIKEGLIKTHNILNHYDALKNNLDFIGFEFTLNIINKFRYELIIHNPSVFKNDDMKILFFKYNENMGYYPIKFDVVRDDGKTKKNIKLFSQKNIEDNTNKKQKYKTIEINNFEIELNKNISEITFLFDAKYEDSLYSNNVDIPEIVYHLSPSKNRKSILKNGIYPKSNSRKVSHSERIYVFEHLSNKETILKALKINDILNQNKTTYDLYEIKLDKNKNILHSDPDSININGYFSYDSIPIKNIKIIDKKL